MRTETYAQLKARSRIPAEMFDSFVLAWAQILYDDYVKRHPELGLLPSSAGGAMISRDRLTSGGE